MSAKKAPEVAGCGGRQQHGSQPGEPRALLTRLEVPALMAAGGGAGRSLGVVNEPAQAVRRREGVPCVFSVAHGSGGGGKMASMGAPRRRRR